MAFNIKTILPCLLLFISIQCSYGQDLHVLPLPQEVIFQQGYFVYNPDKDYTFRYPSIPNTTNALEQIDALFNERAKRINSKNADVVFALANEDELIGLKTAGQIPEHNQGYYIRISAKKMYIYAQTESGLFNAIQTLKQVFDKNLHPQIPTCTIRDFPSLAIRGLMDDISRGPLPNLEFAKAQIRRLSSLKYNLFTFYIEHVVKTKKHGSFAPSEGLTIEEITELSAYAGLHNMSLVGSFQSLGHFDKILAFPQYSDLGVTSRMLKPSDTTAIRFLKDILDETVPAFNADYYNINGDEAWDLSRVPDASTHGTGGLYLNHITPLLDHLIQKEIRPLMWGDILLNHPETIEKLPEETIVLTWDYSDRENFNDWIDPFTDNDIDFWVCPGVLNSNRYIPNFYDAFGNIRGFVEEGIAKGTSGMLLTVWDDGGRHFFSRDWLGVAYGADQSWNPNNKSIDDFISKYAMITYHDTRGVFSGVVEKILSLADLEIMPSMNNGSLSKDIFPQPDQILNFSRKDWMKVHQVAMSAAQDIQTIISSNKDSPYIEDLLYWQFTVDQLSLLADSRIAMIEISAIYKESCFLQKNHPDSVMKNLVIMNETLSDLEAKWIDLFTDFKLYWLKENRTYWQETANEPYLKHLLGLQNLQMRMRDVTDSFDPSTGNYLPAPSIVGMSAGDTEYYFNYWLVTGPFPISNYEIDVLTDYLVSAGGESMVRPIPGDTYKDPEGEQKSWSKVSSEYADRLVFTDLFQQKTKAVAYSYCQIIAPKAVEVSASLGSNDGLALFLNGEEVFRKNIKRNLIKDEDQVTLRLNKGKNYLLVKSDQWKGAWELSFRLRDVNWSSHKHKYTITE